MIIKIEVREFKAVILSTPHMQWAFPLFKHRIGFYGFVWVHDHDDPATQPYGIPGFIKEALQQANGIHQF